MKYTLSTLLFISAIIFYTCTSDVVDTNDETVTGTTAVMLYGKVLDGENEGVPNVVVQLSTTGLTDTTNSDGIYRIHATENSIKQLGFDIDTVNDTVEYYNNNSLVTSTAVANWIDTLPDVYIIQRNISGSLLTTYTQFKRVEAVLKDLDDTTVTPKSSDLWLSTNTFKYSGYLYFLDNAGIQNYSLYVNVYNKDSILTGRSVTETFPSTAGDIELPPFDPFNAVPIVYAGHDFSVSINDTIKLAGTATDAFDGEIVKWEWDIGNTGNFVESPDSTFITLGPSTANTYYMCILRATDNDGNIVTDTIYINVRQDIPVVTALTSTPIVSINDSIFVQGTVVDSIGSITKWEWDIGNTGTFVESADSNFSAIAPSTANAAYPCVLKVTDDDGNIALDTVNINVVTDIPIPSISTTTPTVSIKDTIQLQGTATDTYGSIVKWEWDIGNTGTFVESADSNFSAIAPSTANAAYPCVLKVTDDDSNISYDTIKIIVNTPPSELTMLYPANGATANFDFSNGNGGAVNFNFTAKEPDVDDTLTYVLMLGSTLENQIEIYHGTDTLFPFSDIAPEQQYYWTLTVNDKFNATTNSITGTFYTNLSPNKFYTFNNCMFGPSSITNDTIVFIYDRNITRIYKRDKNIPFTFYNMYKESIGQISFSNGYMYYNHSISTDNYKLYQGNLQNNSRTRIENNGLIYASISTSEGNIVWGGYSSISNEWILNVNNKPITPNLKHENYSFSKNASIYTKSSLSGDQLIYADSAIYLYDLITEETVEITSDLSSNYSISDGNIIWIRDADNKIFLYSNGETKNIGNADNFKIKGNRIVWEKENQIYYYDGNSTSILAEGHSPQISDSTMAWVKDDEIMFYYKNNITQITNNNYYDGKPLISGHNIVWAQGLNESLLDKVILASPFEE